MSIETIKVGKTYALHGQAVEVDGFVNSYTVTVRDVATGQTLDAATSELRSVHADRPQFVDISAIPADVWGKAKSDFDALVETLEVDEIDRATYGRLATRMGCSVRRVQRLRKKLRTACRVSALVPGKRGRRHGSKGVVRDAERVMNHVIRKFYLTRQRPSVAAAYERVKALCLRTGHPLPALETFRRRIYHLDQREVVLAREGAKAARQRFAPRPGRLDVPDHLGVMQIDHTPADVIVVSDDAHRLPIGRPWLTVAIDIRSRAIQGIYVGMHEPNSTSVGLCVAHALLPKTEWLKELGVSAFWPMFGRPKLIVTDNGTEFCGQAMANGCAELGITLEHRPVGRPHWGGHVERVIGTMMGRVHLLPGTTFSNPQQRGTEYVSEKHAALTLREFQQWLVNEICNRYHVTRHRGIGMSPLDAWERGALESVAKKEGN